MSVHGFCLFSNWIVLFLLLNFESALCILACRFVVSWICGLQILSPTLKLFFLSFSHGLWQSVHFNFEEIQFIRFSSYGLSLWCQIQEPLTSPSVLKIFSFFLKTFYFVLGYSQLAMVWWFQVNSEGTLSHTYLCIHSPPNSPPTQSAT